MEIPGEADLDTWLKEVNVDHRSAQSAREEQGAVSARAIGSVGHIKKPKNGADIRPRWQRELSPSVHII